MHLSTRMRYFAYGSNVSSIAMRASCPGHRFLGAAVLPGHRLAFTRRSVVTGTGVADIVADPSSEVWGALYDLSERDLGELDRKEGRGFAYERVPVSVLGCDRGEHAAIAYVVVEKEGVEVPPSAEYLQRVIDGARERALPLGYVASLEQLRRRWG